MARLFRCALAFLRSNERPIWWSLVSGLVIGIATYYFAPKINQEFEIQKIRTEYTIRSLDNISSNTRDFMIRISETGGYANLNDVETRKAYRALQWQSLELALVFEQSSGSELIVDFQTALTELIECQPVTCSEEEASVFMERLARASSNVFRQLAVSANILSR